MFTHILIPTDGSDEALRATKIGIELARSVGARIYAFHVLMPLATVAFISDAIRHAEDSYTERAASRARLHVAEIKAMAEQAGVPCEGGFVFDRRPYAAIVGAAKTHHCDLIVMGKHGHAGFDHILLGSETTKVLSCCDIPVLVCH